MTKVISKTVNGNTTIVAILDKNNQICGGAAFYCGYKGRPAQFVNGQLLVPVTGCEEQEDGSYKRVCIGSEDIIEKF